MTIVLRSVRVRAVVVLGLLPALVACGGGGAAPSTPAAKSSPPTAAVQQVTVKGTDTLRFEPATLTVKAGQPIQVTLDNGGQALHDFTLREGVAQPVAVIAQGGQKSTSQAFTVDRPGSYAFICNQPGHEAGGMKGTLTVQ